ncbi:MAG: hypothetical protein DRI57_24190 [Deltaproteobacteria bacterium]|nr:MAG: hypothetical protein DRI57_24190 [Deltaproteobacteria bacterium]
MSETDPLYDLLSASLRDQFSENPYLEEDTQKARKPQFFVEHSDAFHGFSCLLCIAYFYFWQVQPLK